VGVAALVLGIIALVFALIPFLYTQFVGIVLGLIALILGVVGRKQAAEQGMPTGSATAGMVLGIIATVLSVLFYASCMYCAKKVGDSIEQGSKEFKVKFGEEMKKEFGKGKKGHKEFSKALEKALEGMQKKAGDRDDKLREALDKEVDKALEKAEQGK